MGIFGYQTGEFEVAVMAVRGKSGPDENVDPELHYEKGDHSYSGAATEHLLGELMGDLKI